MRLTLKSKVVLVTIDGDPFKVHNYWAPYVGNMKNSFRVLFP